MRTLDPSRIDGSVCGEINFQNFGQTPAVNARFLLSYRVIDPDAQLGSIVNSVPKVAGHPGRAIVQGRHSIGQMDPIREKDLSGSAAALKRIIVVAQSEYSDVIKSDIHQTGEVWKIPVRPVTPFNNRKPFYAEISFVHIPEFWLGK